MGKRCYYDNEFCDYERGLWQCQTCGEWFCYAHDHMTSKGVNVECVACEYQREQKEFEEIANDARDSRD
jgi:hypothetical protein